MPTYTYECSLCGTRWDEQRKFSDCCVDVSSDVCPECGDPIAPRVFNPGAMRPVFKGRGWPRKDHKDASKP